RALELQAHDVLTMAVSAGNLRRDEQIFFVYQHQQLVNQLLDRELQLQDQKDLLALNVRLANKKEQEAISQEALVKEKDLELQKLQDETAKGRRDAKGKLERAGLEQLEQEQLKVFRLRMLLRDANRLNQEAER